MITKLNYNNLLIGWYKMLHRYDLPDILYKALKDLGGKSNIIDVCKYVWNNHEQDLKSSGDLFYTWQYDIRWAATELRKLKKMKDKDVSPKGIWEILS